jgi:cystathionine beta-lyase/cystathionine gamma-synthase
LDSSEDAEAIFSGARKGHAYTRFGNPTVDHLARLLADLEGGQGALVTASGNAATLTALCMSLKSGRNLIVSHPDLYGGTLELLRLFSSRFRVPVALINPSREDSWFRAIQRSSILFVETPSNPLMRLIDLRRCGLVARKSGARFIVDNTVATPLGQRPFDFGADLIVHSLSKYLNGHSDMIGGCVIHKGALDEGQRAVHKNLGGTVNALDAYLLCRGLRTFPLRMAAHHTNAPRVAEFLARHPRVARVHYPGLSDHPQASLVARQMKHPGALLSFEFAGGERAARRFLNRIRLVVHAVSLGGLESLATRPAATSHRGMSAADKKRAGIVDRLIRLPSAQSPSMTLNDLEQALGADRHFETRSISIPE